MQTPCGWPAYTNEGATVYTSSRALGLVALGLGPNLEFNSCCAAQKTAQLGICQHGLRKAKRACAGALTERAGFFMPTRANISTRCASFGGDSWELPGALALTQDDGLLGEAGRMINSPDHPGSGRLRAFAALGQAGTQLPRAWADSSVVGFGTRGHDVRESTTMRGATRCGERAGSENPTGPMPWCQGHALGATASSEDR